MKRLSILLMIGFTAAVFAGKPNVVLIVCDDLNDYITGIYGHHSDGNVWPTWYKLPVLRNSKSLMPQYALQKQQLYMKLKNLTGMNLQP